MNQAGKDDWQLCSTEVITELITLSHKETRRAMLKRIGLVSAGLFTIFAGGMFWWANRKPTLEEIRSKLVLPIQCDEVRTKLALYHASELDDATCRRIGCHLYRCRSCRTFYKQNFEVASVNTRCRQANPEHMADESA